MDVLVAGTGFIGSKIIEELEEEHQVKTLDRSEADYQKDITQEFDIHESFDVIFHTIGLAPGMKDRTMYEKVHVEGTQNLLKGIEAEKVVYLSALNAGEVEHSFFQTKKKAEELIKDSNKKYTIIRPSTVYGKGNKLLEMIKKTAPLRIFPDIKTKTQPIHIEDLGKILARSVEEFDNKTLEIAGPVSMTISEMARKLYREEGYRCILLPAPQLLQKTGLKLIPFSGPFSKENIQLLKQQNTTKNNDALDILGELRAI